MSGSGSLLGGIVGAVIGFFAGGPAGAMYGWTIGAMAGGLLFPGTGPDGPRLEDLKPQSSEFGRPIPIVYGTVALGGNIIWASDLVEEEGSTGGDCGEPEMSTFSYFANFAVAICEGEVALGRIWAGPDKRLIYDGATLEGVELGALVRFYSGAADQLPDPLIESYEGVGNVPAYRGTAYVVFEHFPVGKDFNRIPFLTIEVGQAIDANVAPEELGTVWVSAVVVTDSFYASLYYGSNQGMVIRNLDDYSAYKHFSSGLGGSFPGNSPNWFFDEDRQVFVHWTSDGMSYSTMPAATGLLTAHTIVADTILGTPDNPGTLVRGAVYHNGTYIFAAAGSPGAASRVTLYVMNPDTHEAVATYETDSIGVFVGPLMKPPDASPWVAGYSTTQLARYTLEHSVSPLFLGAGVTDATAVALDPSTGYIWSAALAGGTLSIRCNDSTASGLLYEDSITTPMWAMAAQPFTFVPGVPNILIIAGVWGTTLSEDRFITINADTFGLISDEPGGYHGILGIQAMFWNPITEQLVAIRRNGVVTYAAGADPTTANLLNYTTGEAEADNTNLGEADATINPQGQQLSDVITDLSLRAGLTADQIDVSQLTDTVDGYAIGTQTSVREAITALAPAYFFDACESEGVIKFVKRGGEIALVIPDEDVGAFEAGSDPVDAIEKTRRMEHELPRVMNVKYIQAANNYSPAARSARRLVGSSGDEQTKDLPLVLTDTKAQQIADVNLHGEWVARLTYSFTLTRKYSYLEPTDPIVVYGKTMRLTKTVQADGVIRCEATHDDSQVYSPNVVVTETPPNGGSVSTPDEVVTLAETTLELM